MKINKILLIALLPLLFLSGCRNEQEEATKLGFSDSQEMKKIQALGWHNKERYNEDSAIIAGYSSYAEMKVAEEKKRKIEEEKKRAEELALQKKREEEDRRLNAEKYCKSDWTACATTEMLIENYSGISQIRSKCERATGMVAKWDYQFVYSPAYTSYYNSESDLKEGKLRLIDNDVKFQNGFGAWRKLAVVCYYDLKQQNAYLVMEK